MSLTSYMCKTRQADPFSVKWGGVIYVLQPHEKKIWMRFLAEHFAKYLADSILMKREQQHKKDYLARGGSEREYVPKSYLNSRTMRPEVIDSILVGVYQYHQGDAVDPNAMIQRQIDQMNPQQQQERPLELGEAADPLYGVLKDDQPDASPPPPLSAPPVPSEPGASMLPPENPAPAPLPTAPQQPAQTISNLPPAPSPAPPNPADDDRSMQALRAEAAKLDITVPFGTSKDALKEMIRKQYA
jgi:hypothetical protein